MWEFFEIMLIVFFLSLLVCPAIVIYWFFNSSARENFYSKHKNLCMAIYVLSFFSVSLMIFQGVKTYLFFIPENWGSFDEDGKFLPYKNAIAIILALSVTFFIAHIFNKVEKLKKENKELFDKAEGLEEENQELEDLVESLEEKNQELKDSNDRERKK